jgi:hypothetical protein
MEDTQYCNVMLNYEFKGDIEARTRITPAPTITLGGQRIQIIDDQALVGIRACLRSPPYVGNQCDETTKEDLRKEMKRALGLAKQRDSQTETDLVLSACQIICTTCQINLEEVTGRLHTGKKKFAAPEARSPAANVEVTIRGIPLAESKKSQEYEEFAKEARKCKKLLSTCQGCEGLANVDWWPLVIENIWFLALGEVTKKDGIPKRIGEEFYLKFFPQISDMVRRMREFVPPLEIRLHLIDLFQKRIAQKYQDDVNFGAIKGAASEVLNALSSTLIDRGRVRKIAVPKNPVKWFVPYEDIKSGQERKGQDIDRVELFQTETPVAQELLAAQKRLAAIYDMDNEPPAKTYVIQTHVNIKFYIEVKADAHTAVDSHQRNQRQLEDIVRVINYKKTTAKLKNQAKMALGILSYEPAVSITNADGWLELFTSGVARIYYQKRFYLFIGGAIFNPGELQKIDDQIREKATGLQKEGRRPQLSKLSAKNFPCPTFLAMNNLRLPEEIDWKYASEKVAH